MGREIEIKIPLTDAEYEKIFKVISGYSTMDTENTEFEHIFSVAPAQYIRFSSINDRVKQKNIYWKPGKKKARQPEPSEKGYANERMQSLVGRRSDP